MTPAPMTDAELDLIDAWWRAANYLTVGQIYLQANPLLREPLRPEHIKPRLLGHWGTSPGLSFLYAHLNRVIRRDDLDMIYVAGPGPRRPGAAGQRLPRGHLQRGLPRGLAATSSGCSGCSASSPRPGGIPSHVSVPTPGRSTRAASSATRWCTPSARRSTTPS